MANYNETYKSQMDWQNVFVRTGSFPLDRSSIFGSYKDAEKYAMGDGSDSRGLGKTSYIGQFIAVYENGVVDIYQITEERKIRKVMHENDLQNIISEINENISTELQTLKPIPLTTESITNSIQTTISGTTFKSNINLSDDLNNILKINDDGICASIDINYDTTLNKLILQTSNGNKEIALSNQSFLDSISYDSLQKKLIMKIKLSNNEIITQEIDLGDLFNPINVENSVDSPITLNKIKNDYTGIETITAFIEVSSSDDNLIEIKKDGSTANLFASNKANNINVLWYNFNDDGDIIDVEKDNMQNAITKIARYFKINEGVSGNVTSEILKILERIEGLEQDIEDNQNKLNALTDFGYTDE